MTKKQQIFDMKDKNNSFNKLQKDNKDNKKHDFINNSNIHFLHSNHKVLNTQYKNYNLHTNNSKSSSRFNIPEPLQLLPLAPLTFNMWAAYPLSLQALQDLQSLQGFNLSLKNSRQKQFQAILQKFQNQFNIKLHLKNQHIQKLQQDLILLKQLYNEQKQKYLDLKNLYKEGQYLFLVLQDKKNSIQKQNKQLKVYIQEELSKLKSNPKSTPKCFNQHHHNNNIHTHNFNHLNQFDNSHSRSCQSQTSQVQSHNQLHQQSNQQFHNNFKNQPKNKQKQSLSVPHPNKSSNSTRIKIGRKQKEIPVIKVNVPQQTFTFTTNFKIAQTQKQEKQQKHQKQLKQSKQGWKNVKKSQANLQTGTSQYINNNNHSTSAIENPSRLLQFNPIVQSSSLYQPFQSSSQQPYLPYYSQSQNKSSFKDFTISSEFQSQQSNSQSQPLYFKTKYEYCQKQLLKKDQLLKNLYEQCYKLQKQLDDLRLFDTFKQDFKKQKTLTTTGNYQDANHNDKNNKRIQQLQEKIISLTSYSKKLLSDCDDVIKQLRCQNQLLVEKNRQFQETIKTQQDQLKRLYKVLQNKNIELGQIYSSLKLAQSRKKISGYSSNYFNEKQENQSEHKHKFR